MNRTESSASFHRLHLLLLPWLPAGRLRFSYLSRRMDSVFLSLSSHVSFSSAMIFSVSCHTRARVSARSDQLTMTPSYHQPLCCLLFADGLRGNRLLPIPHQLVGGRGFSRHLVIICKETHSS